MDGNKVNPLKENPEGLFGIQWHITDNCDQRCKHCYIFSEGKNNRLVSMDIAQMTEVLRKCEEFTAKMDMRPNFAITGGDPVLAPDFWKLSDLLKEKGYRYTIMGNPFHLTPEVCKRLKDSGCTAYQLSIDGTEKTHDDIRMPGSYKKTLETVPMIVRSGMLSVIMMTVSEMNYRQLPEVMDAAENAGADVFSFARYVPTSAEKAVGIAPEEYRRLLGIYAKKRSEALRRGSFTRFVIKDHLLTLYYYEEGRFKPPVYEHKPGDHMPAGCHCGNAMLTILPDGTVMACRRMESSGLGNIFTDDLAEMYDKAKHTYRRYDEFETCSRCRLSPWCRGCPAVAAAETGSFLGRDPQCWRVVEQ